MIQKDLKGIFLLVFFALITAFSYNYLSPSGIPLFGQWEPLKTDSIKADSIEIIKPSVKKK